MLASGSKQTSKAIPLLLMVVAARLPPFVPEVGDHHPYLSLHFALLVIVAQKNHLPMLTRQLKSFLLCACFGEFFRPVVQVSYIALGIAVSISLSSTRSVLVKGSVMPASAIVHALV